LKVGFAFGSKLYSGWGITIFASGQVSENEKDNEYSDRVVHCFIQCN